MKKTGRNEPCPCGSGKKYKRCHGSLDQPNIIPRQISAAEAEALYLQRQRQQGLGRPIISTEAFGQRLIAVKNKLYYSKKWQTFHDFLCAYLPDVLGAEWGNSEITKPFEQRHPILVWYHYLCEHQQKYVKEPGVPYSAPMTGAVAAYMRLAYDLYALEHNSELQSKLLSRLRNIDNFYGARYEVFVAAALIRAGFKIEFEDEDDRRSSHCEYTATFIRTGKAFSVEAKQRSGNKFRLGRQLNRALKKQASHQRLIFIEINAPDNTAGTDIPVYLEDAIASLKSFEGKVINGKALPNAYLIVTNIPWHHHPESQITKSVGLMDGFQIPDFKSGRVEYPSLRAAIEARDRHIEMRDLFNSMKDNSEIPSTFDGDIPEFSFGESHNRLIIGQRYLVRDGDGVERTGILTTATVSESEKTAHCIILFDNGESGIWGLPLSDDEMAIWRKYPDTFFGQFIQHSRSITDPLDLYDFFLNGYRATPRARLLEMLATAPDIDELKKLDQKCLASIYAERSANTVIAQNPGFNEESKSK